MEILTKSIKSFEFDNVVSFCEKKYTEGVELDYKMDFPDSAKLSELVCAFSNTRGGVIIIGVKEDKSTGKPIEWNGIDEGHYEETLSQIVGNITPIPKTEYWQTSPKNKKVFCLIRVFEGDETPYYPHNDNNMWIRTGSVRKSVDLASPEAAELLYKKAERASQSRTLNLDRADRNYNSYLANADIERGREVAEEEDKDKKRRQEMPDGGAMLGPFKSLIVKQTVGSNTAMLKIAIQPFYPNKDFVRPLEMETILDETRYEAGIASFPKNDNWKSMQQGMMFLDWNRETGYVICQQAFSNGLMYYNQDVLSSFNGEPPTLYLQWFTSSLYALLKSSSKIFENLGYQGSIVGSMEVNNIKGLVVVPAIEGGRNKESVFDFHKCYIDTDTNILKDEEKLKEYVTEVTRELHWDFGFKELQKYVSVKTLETRSLFTRR